jgi:hypothetical protein
LLATGLFVVLLEKCFRARKIRGRTANLNKINRSPNKSKHNTKIK